MDENQGVILTVLPDEDRLVMVEEPFSYAKAYANLINSLGNKNITYSSYSVGDKVKIIDGYLIGEYRNSIWRIVRIQNGELELNNTWFYTKYQVVPISEDCNTIRLLNGYEYEAGPFERAIK